MTGADRAGTVRVGLYVGVDDLPADGWPDEVDDAVLERILRLLPDE